MYYLLIAITGVYLYLEAVSPRYIFPQNQHAEPLTLTPVPWVGALIFKPEGNMTPTTTTVVLISYKTAIGNAKVLVKLSEYEESEIREHANVMFLTADNDKWYANITNIIVHPDFSEETLTTVAIIYLDHKDVTHKYPFNPLHKVYGIKGSMLTWPSEIQIIPYTSDNIFAVGYRDWNGDFEQIVYRMDSVDVDNCLQFYINENLDYRWLRPISYHCYNVRYAKEPCVFNPGLALIQHDSNGPWILLGISTSGPGCALPTRFLDFFYYVPWIKDVLQAKQAARTDVWFRDRIFSRDWWKPDKADIKDLDTWILAQVKNNSYILKPASKRRLVESVYGDCNDPKNILPIKLMYRDRSFYKNEEPVTEMTAIYGVSLYDLKFKNISCVQVIAAADNKSDSVLWYTKTFEQDHDFMDYIRQIPEVVFKGYEDRQYFLTETFAKYKYEIIGTDVTHLMFRFHFRKKAYIEVFFFGYLELPTTTTTTDSPPSTTLPNRTRRIYTTSTRCKPLRPVPFRKTTKRTISRTTTPPPTTTPPKLHWWNDYWYFNPDRNYDWWHSIGKVTPGVYNNNIPQDPILLPSPNITVPPYWGHEGFESDRL